MLDKYKDKIKSSNFKYIPIVLGSNANALGITRSLGKNNLPVIVADYENGIAFYSRYAISEKIGNCVTNRKEFLKSLYNIASFLETVNKIGILYCSSDAYLFAIGESIYELQEKFKIILSDWNNVKRCLDKSFLYKEAERLNIPYPNTFYAKNSSEMIQAVDILKYPILIKPAITVGFSNVYKKAVIVESEEDLRKVQNEIDQLGLSEYELIMQEMIPGPVESLYTFSSYSDEFGEVKAYSIGHKIRQTPPDTGTITAGKVSNNDELARLGIDFIKGLRFHGIANTEFKLDQRDGKFKLIEINPRPGLWNYSATAAGVNLSWIAYQNVALGINQPIKYSDRTLVWIYDIMDVSRAVFSNKYGHGKTRISLSEWFKSIKGNRTYAIWQIKDPKPFVSLIYNLLLKIVKS